VIFTVNKVIGRKPNLLLAGRTSFLSTVIFPSSTQPALGTFRTTDAGTSSLTNHPSHLELLLALLVPSPSDPLSSGLPLRLASRYSCVRHVSPCYRYASFCTHHS
jgi:hypothetical protein